MGDNGEMSLVRSAKKKEERMFLFFLSHHRFIVFHRPLVLHAPYRMPITFITQIVIAFGLKVIDSAAPSFDSVEIIGAPESGLLAGMVIAGFSIIASRGGVKAGNRFRFNVIGVPKLRERFHHFPSNGMATQSLEEFLPFAVVR